ncbi:hypothetical protein SAMN02745248_01260 [Hathewaya proteolytica DSM 3090]|uniref:UPF0246 protein SAMN02745248_01260 n=1 Tax=Hathewaya proteolytica DSM 3090 TaxID=1121331 RepID=A0A1M6N441_9CLOT|nr:peroxide stress protein YaaA [Hathewaya proteolytica]SHJ90450.1 hypothetical protein SAMN02745248_01260 [Hathewaya proteolytica DSM 3090]
MRIIISPAKKMKVDDDSLEFKNLPVFLEDTRQTMEWMKSLSMNEAKELWGCNEKIAKQNYERFQNMNLTEGLTPAILAYEGIQYQYMAPAVFEEKMLAYVQEHLRILSGFYGVLKPMDGVTPYRLEMQAKTQIGDVEGLYDFWKEKLYDELVDDSHIIINLASKEYSRCIESYLQPDDRFITCIFGEMANGKVVQKGTYAKMARGEMVRFMASRNINEADGIKEFNMMGYKYKEELSTDTEYVFLK